MSGNCNHFVQSLHFSDCKGRCQSKGLQWLCNVDLWSSIPCTSSLLTILLSYKFPFKLGLLLLSQVLSKYWNCTHLYSGLIYSILVYYFDEDLKRTRKKSHEKDAVEETAWIHLIFYSPFEEHSLVYLCIFHFLQFMLLPFKLTLLLLSCCDKKQIYSMECWHFSVDDM